MAHLLPPAAPELRSKLGTPVTLSRALPPYFAPAGLQPGDVAEGATARFLDLPLPPNLMPSAFGSLIRVEYRLVVTLKVRKFEVSDLAEASYMDPLR